MTDFKRIYQTQAEAYDYLVSHEDYEGHILPALLAIRPFTQASVVELGAGTGRLTRLVAPLVERIVACDIALPMLAVAGQRLAQEGQYNWQAVVCDNRALALADATADIALTGWSLGHFTSWYATEWRQEIGLAVAEMKRVLRPDGTLIILETLGTNRQTPQPPTPELATYYRWLEEEQGCQFTWIRTDYGYPGVVEAVDSVRFFFGDTMARAVQRQNSRIVPECTGIWWRHI